MAGMTGKRLSVWAIWAAALLGVVGIGVLAAPEQQITWVSILMVVLISVTCLVQLGLQEAEGFVQRMSLSLVGALGILTAGSIVLLLLGGDAMVGAAQPGR